MWSSLADAYEDSVELVHNEFGSRLTTLWALDPVLRRLHHVALAGAHPDDLGSLVLEIDNSFSGVAVDELSDQEHRLDEELSSQRIFADPFLKEKLGLKRMISMPIMNSSNPNQVLYVINTFFGDESPPDNELRSFLIKLIGERIERAIQDLCLKSMRISFARIGGFEIDDICKAFSDSLLNAVSCDLAAIYLHRPGEDDLKLDGYSSRNQAGIRRLAEMETTLNEKARAAWISGRERLYLGEEFGITKEETEHVSAAVLPITDSNGIRHGAIVCVGLGQKHGVRYQAFSLNYADLTIMDAVVQAFLPYNDLLMAERERLDGYARLYHELKRPVVAFRSAIQYAKRESDAANVHFRHDYFSELKRWAESMRRKLQEIQSAANEKGQPLQLETELTNISSQTIAATTRHSESLLRQHRLSTSVIDRSGIGWLPRLYLDGSRVDLVVFNLIEMR